MPDAWNINESTTDPSHRPDAERGRANAAPETDQDSTAADEATADLQQ